MGKGLILSAPNSGSGKTVITLGILRALKERSVDIISAKSGPDYIDPRFHALASQSECFNLDAWALSEGRLTSIASKKNNYLIIEGAMGLFDGALPNAQGSTAHLGQILKLPIILIIDASKTSQSIAAIAQGFINFDHRLKIGGIILNKVGSKKHERILKNSLNAINIPVLGCVYRDSQLKLPSRHLGLVQAQELSDLNNFINNAAQIMESSIDLDQLIKICTDLPSQTTSEIISPPAQRIAIASDAAFAFTYPHILDDWHKSGAEISTFSPLSDQVPDECDLVFLPGGYPELYAAKLANAHQFKKAVKASANVYGECGGYMTMGNILIDEEGYAHKMLGLLNLETSFVNKKLHLGYRKIYAEDGFFTGSYSAHEFHYATTLTANGPPLFAAEDADGVFLDNMGLHIGQTCGSFAHIISGP